MLEPPASPSAEHALALPAWPTPSLGRNRAFRALYDRHFRLVWTVVRSGGVLPAHCEDVAQEVWLQVHRLVDRLRPDASARAWLVSIARRRVAQYHRAQRRRARKEAAFGQAAPLGVEPHGGRVEARSTVDRVLHGMSEEQRLTFVLVHAYGLTGEEVASAVGDSVNTVYSRLRLARRHLGRATAAARLEEHRVSQAVHAYAQPPRGAKSRLRVLLALELGLPGLGAVVPTGMLVPSAIGASIVAGLTALRLWIGPPAPPERSAPGSSAVAAIEGEAEAETASPPTTAAADAADVREPAVAVALAGRPATERSDVEPPKPGRASTAAREPRSSSLSEETAVLKRAKRALDDGAPEQALALLEEHARRFPRAVLEDVRHGVRVRALCAMGRVAEARREATRMASTRAGSVVALGVEDVCAAALATDDAEARDAGP